MRSLPNMTVIVPADYNQMRQAVKFAANYNGPVYIRSSRINVPDIYDEDYKLELNKAVILKEGKDISIFSNGDIFSEVIKASEMLAEKGIDAEIINVPFVKPLDTDTIIKSINKTGIGITIENHSVIGGLGSAVCECVSEISPHKVVRFGVNDTFGQSGTPKELLKYYELDTESITKRIVEILK